MNTSKISSELSAITLPSLRPHAISAWHGHLSFAHWLVQAVKPSRVVELGTHNGLSYSGFCNAISKFSPDAKCYAIDTWEGDIHAGAYSNAVFEDLALFSAEKFPTIGVMVRSYFDDALTSFEDSSVDILHIDGLHTYDAVRHDFESWKPKLSDRAVVLFHDTEVRGSDFGVWKYWAELLTRYPNFNFLHSAGLGVLAVGRNQPKAILDLCASSASDAGLIRDLFERASQASKVYGQHLQAVSASHLTPSAAANLARNKPTTQSSRFEDGNLRQSATDGVKDGTYGFHTNQEKNPWIVVDLQKNEKVSKVVIYNRLSDQCVERARNLCVAVSSDAMSWIDVYKHDGSFFGGVDGRPLIVPVEKEARFVRAWLADVNFFHLDQIEIY